MSDLKYAAKLALEMVQNKMYAHAEMYLTEALAKQEQGEPVAWCVTYNKELTGNIYENKRIAEMSKRNLDARYGTENAERAVIPIYTTPQQRTWVGLTDDDKMAFLAQDFGGNRLDAMDWAEKRLKEKNT